MDGMADRMEITEVNCATSPDAGLVLLAPRQGARYDQYFFRVAGCLTVGDASAVEVWNDAEVIGVCPLGQAPPDASGAQSSREFAVECAAVGLPDSFSLSIMVVLSGNTRVRLGRIHGRMRSIGSAYEPRFQPLMVTSLGRTGTTWLMRLLVQHPAVAAYPAYPYESRFAGYWIQMLKVLSGAADHVRSSGPNSFSENPYLIGHNPFYRPVLPELGTVRRWYATDYVEELAAFCQRSTDEVYERIAAELDHPDATFFVEKTNPGPVPALVHQLYSGAREVVLVRDFRDMVSSMLAFNRKRGYDAFGRENTDDDVEFVRSMGRSVDCLLKDWKLRSSSALLVRYEDLMSMPVTTLRRVFQHAGIDDSEALSSQVVEDAGQQSVEMDQHRTTDKGDRSVGRWKMDLDPEMQEACDEAFGPALGVFGY